MKVARAYSIDDVRLEEAPIPTLGPGDALLEVQACGLCSSDCLDWYVASKAPIVLGHEPAGTIVDLGARVQGFARGTRVFTHHHVSCGECAACKRGADTSCSLFKTTALEPGGFAQYLRIPEENLRRDTLVIPDSLDWESATWIEPLACTLRVFTKAPPLTARDTSLVIGLGSMGLLNGMAARSLGAGRVLGSDPVDSRRQMARTLGFDAAFDPTTADAAESLRAVNGGQLADLIIVGPGSVSAIEQALTCAAPGAVVVLFTPTPASQRLPLSTHALYFGEITLTASYSCGPSQTREALHWLSTGRLDPRPLVTHRGGLADVGPAIRRTVAKGPDLKTVIFPNQ